MIDALVAEPAPPLGYAGPPTFSVPNGTLIDLFESFSGRPLYDPERLPMPVLLVRGEDDQTSTAVDMRALQQRMVHSPVQCETLPDAGHFICAERAAPVLQRLLGGFLARHSSLVAHGGASR
jgi:pimeloyl-ACP methyl ester carboxylesterase